MPTVLRRQTVFLLPPCGLDHAWFIHRRIVQLSAERRKAKSATRDGKRGNQIGQEHLANRQQTYRRSRGGDAKNLGPMTFGKAASDEPSESVHGEAPFELSRLGC